MLTIYPSPSPWTLKHFLMPIPYQILRTEIFTVDLYNKHSKCDMFKVTSQSQSQKWEKPKDCRSFPIAQADLLAQRSLQAAQLLCLWILCLFWEFIGKQHWSDDRKLLNLLPLKQKPVKESSFQTNYFLLLRMAAQEFQSDLYKESWGLFFPFQRINKSYGKHNSGLHINLTFSLPF